MGRSRSRRRRGKTGGQGSGGSGKGKGTGGSRGRSSNNRGGQGKGGSGTGGTGGSRGRSNNTRGGQHKANRNQNLKARKAVSPTMNKIGAGFSLGGDVYNNIVGHLLRGNAAKAIENASRIHNKIKAPPSDWQIKMGLKHNLDYTDMQAGPKINVDVNRALQHFGKEDSWWGKRLPNFVKNIKFNHQFYSPKKLKPGDDKYTNPGTTNRGGKNFDSGPQAITAKTPEAKNNFLKIIQQQPPTQAVPPPTTPAVPSNSLNNFLKIIRK